MDLYTIHSCSDTASELSLYDCVSVLEYFRVFFTPSLPGRHIYEYNKHETYEYRSWIYNTSKQLSTGRETIYVLRTRTGR